MTLILAFIVAHLGAIVGGLIGLAGVAFGGVRHLQAKSATSDAAAVKADAARTVESVKAGSAQADAKASAATVDAMQDRSTIDAAQAAKTPQEARDELSTWTK